MDQRTTEDLRAIVGEELGADADRVQMEVGRGPAAGCCWPAPRAPTWPCSSWGARGLGGFDGLFLGSVSQQCVEHSPSPVVVLRGDQTPTDGPIVVGLDGSEGSKRALTWAIDHADATGSELVAVHAPGTGASGTVLDQASNALKNWCAPIRARGIAHQQRVEGGDVRTALERVADETDAARLVVGARGLGPVQGLLLGSVAGYVVRYANGLSPSSPDPAAEPEDRPVIHDDFTPTHSVTPLPGMRPRGHKRWRGRRQAKYPLGPRPRGRVDRRRLQRVGRRPR